MIYFLLLLAIAMPTRRAKSPAAQVAKAPGKWRQKFANNYVGKKLKQFKNWWTGRTAYERDQRNQRAMAHTTTLWPKEKQHPGKSELKTITEKGETQFLKDSANLPPSGSGRTAEMNSATLA